MLYGNPFFFVLSLYNHLNPFLKFQSPFYFDPPLIAFRNFFQPPCLLGPPVYLALASSYLIAGFILAVTYNSLLAFSVVCFIVSILLWEAL